MTHIVIVGAGYAGLRAALDLDALLARKPGLVRLTLIDRNPYHQIVQTLHQTATEAIPSSQSIVELRRVLRDRTGVALHQSEVRALSLAAQQVQTADGAVSYDRLVIALGARTDYGNIPGAPEHSLPLRSYDDALRLRGQIRACFAQAARADDPAVRRHLLTFVIAGGGYTGCQLAGELAAWAESLCREHGLAPSEVRVALFQRDAQLLPQLGSWAEAEAERALRERGVSVHLNTPVERVEPGLLRLGGVAVGTVLRSNTIVWAAGIRAPALLADAGLPCDERGRVLVDDHLRVAGYEGVYACGDCARVPASAAAAVPATASYALRQGEYLAPLLLADMHGEPHAAYRPLALGELVSLGPNQAVGNPLGARLTGLPAALLKQGVEQWYLGRSGRCRAVPAGRLYIAGTALHRRDGSTSPGRLYIA